MQPYVLAFFALLAPLPAAALDRLSCATFTTCWLATGCDDATEPSFDVAFDWPVDSVQVMIEGETHALLIVETDEFEDTRELYANTPDTDNHSQLTLIFGDTTATALWTPDTPQGDEHTHTATCIPQDVTS